MDEVDKRLRELLYQMAEEHEWEIEALEIMPDHVPMFISFDPRYAVAEIVNRLKGATSRVLRSEFRHLRSRIPTLWSRSYYAGTVGLSAGRDHVSAQVILQRAGSLPSGGNAGVVVKSVSREAVCFS